MYIVSQKRNFLRLAIKNTIPINTYLPPRKKVCVLRTKNWEERLIKKAVNALNEDIRLSLLHYQYAADRIPAGTTEKPSFYIFILSNSVASPAIFIANGKPPSIFFIY